MVFKILLGLGKILGSVVELCFHISYISTRQSRFNKSCRVMEVGLGQANVNVTMATLLNLATNAKKDSIKIRKILLTSAVLVSLERSADHARAIYTEQNMARFT